MIRAIKITLTFLLGMGLSMWINSLPRPVCIDIPIITEGFKCP